MSQKVSYLKLIKTTLFGALIIGLNSYLATYVSTKIAAIVWSIPLTLFPTMILMWNMGISNNEIGNYAFNSGLGCVNLITFSVLIGYILNYTSLSDDSNYGFLYALGIASLVWTLGSILLYFYSPY